MQRALIGIALVAVVFPCLGTRAVAECAPYDFACQRIEDQERAREAARRAEVLARTMKAVQQSTCDLPSFRDAMGPPRPAAERALDQLLCRLEQLEGRVRELEAAR